MLPKKNRLASIVRIIPKLLDLDGKCLITADHSNCKQTRNPGGSPNTHRSRKTKCEGEKRLARVLVRLNHSFHSNNAARESKPFILDPGAL